MNINELNNFSQSFIFSDLHVRGNIVRLTDVYQRINAMQQVSGPAAQLLGQVMVAAAMLIQPIKTASNLTIQFQSENDVKLLAVKVNTDGNMRATIMCDTPPKEALLGQGYLVVTINQYHSNTPRQSVIEIHEGQTVSEALARYFKQSEQLPSLFYFACNAESITGIMIQQDLEKVSSDDWNTLSHLFASITDEELLKLDSETIVYRLFNQFKIEIFPKKPLAFKCDCSLEKMQSAIMSLGEEDAKELIASKSLIEVSCEYCKNHYGFDKNDIQRIFSKH